MTLQREFAATGFLDQHHSYLNSKSYFIPTDKRSYCASTKKFLFTAHVDHHRKPQLDIMERSMSHRELSPNGYICISGPASMVQKTSHCKGQNTKKSAAKHSFLEMSVQTRPEQRQNQ